MSEDNKQTQAVASNAPAAAKNGEAPRRKFGSANNFSSDNMNSHGGRGRRGGRDNRRSNRRDRSNEDKQFEEQTISIDRVSRTVKGGRRLRFKALVVVSDRKARVGVGVAKGRDVQQAIEKANNIAKKSMITIPIENATIPHDIEIKFGASRVMLKPAAPGTGIIAGGVVRAIIGITGVNNLVTKSLGSTNKVNIAYATIQALGSLKPRSEWSGVKDKMSQSDAKPAKKAAKTAETTKATAKEDK